MANIKTNNRIQYADTPAFHPAPDPVTQCEQIAYNLYRIRRGTGYPVEVEATENQIHQWTGVPLDVALPWNECELCGVRFLDWDGGGLCAKCASTIPYEDEFYSVAELDRDSAGL